MLNNNFCSLPENESIMIAKRIFTTVEIPQNTTHTSNTFLARIWAFQFKLFYYAGLVPYKPVHDCESGVWILKTSPTFARILSITIIWIPHFVWNIAGTLRRIADLYISEKRYPKLYFGAIHRIRITSSNILFAYILQNGRDQFQKLINQSSLSGSFIQSCTSKKKKCSSKNLAMFYLALVFLIRYGSTVVTVFAVDTKSFTKWLGTPEEFQRTVEKGSERFFASGADNIDVPGYYILGIFSHIMRSVNWFVYANMIPMIVGTIPITLWLATNGFTKSVGQYYQNMESASGSGKLLEEIRSAYQQLKEYSNSLNEMWSTLYLVWLLEMALYRAMNINNNLESGNMYSLLYFVFEVCVRTVALFLSGDVYKMIERFKLSLTDWSVWHRFRGGEEKDELQRMLLELESRPIGIGSSGVYQLTFGFTAQVCALIITVFLISFDQ